MRHLLIFVMAAALLAGACGSSESDATSSTPATAPTTTAGPTTSAAPTSTSSTSTTTSSTTTSSTTTTAAPAATSPLNGLEVADPALLERRVVAVKVDNHPKARPQSGLQAADAVIEMLVEGVTRFIALFHHSDTGYLGPVRSIRPTDSTLLEALGATFVVSGGQDWVKALTADRDVAFLTEGVGGLFRISSRVAPQNLYADTIDLRRDADSRGIDDDIDGPLLVFADWESTPETTAEVIDLSWAAGAQVRWRFTDGAYLRFTVGSEHRWVDADGNGGQLTFDTVIVIETTQYTASPQAGYGGSSVPASETTGTGRMAVFHDGYVVEGTWEREAFTEPFRFFDGNGDPVTVPPGIPWISIYPAGVDWSWS